MAMWKVVVAPTENPEIWTICRNRDIIVIGWPQHRPDWERNLNVRRFRDQMQVGDWVVAHLPARLAYILPHGLEGLVGVGYLGVGLGRITGDYEEKSDLDPREFRADSYRVDFWRQHRVKWESLEPRSLRGILSGGILTHAVAPLSANRAQEVLRRYGVG